MENSFSKFMDSIKKIKHRSEMEFDASEFMLDMLRRIEFSNSGGHERLVGRAKTQVILVNKCTNQRHLHFLMKNYIRFFTTALDLMTVQAVRIANDKKVELVKPDYLNRIQYQKTLVRAVRRATEAEGQYSTYMEEHDSEDSNVESGVVIELNGFIFRTESNDRHDLVFTAIVRGLRYNPLNGNYEVERDLESLF